MFRLMLVEDDTKLAALIQEYLSSYEFKVEIIGRGDTALAHYKATLPDIIVLDLMLPGLDGMVVCRQIREISSVPILILTAREDMFDEVSGLEQGADDYVNKPIQPRILLARLRALLRRGAGKQSNSNAPLNFGDLEISKTDRSVRWKNENASLSNSEFKLLLLLAESAGRVLSRDDILKSMRGIEFDGMDRSIDNSISRLRRKFNDHDSEKIKTVWGEGYLFSPSAWE
ncbi:response regulator [Iodobacter fluviatilis]|uniref:Transcriptional regulatory protein RstA n=1 Tax=Iodobacter fluviatilis TaxID=537 RepID=A0A377QAB5_9NEIS|nr:response regulator [Iodobacter fluviatilis]TCU89431.1 winged helix family two component transcriptional regulator [Iodobacter fluviatilis]STQ90801.1 Transcriptional regulatory protein RstA [Iodobacter fluviatilis]